MHTLQNRSDLKPTSRGRVVGLGLGKFRFIGGGVAFLLAASAAFAGPEGAKVREGTARFTQRGDRTIIRVSDRAIIDYTRFNIGRNETVRFIQPNATSRVLNRITGARPTTIDGKLLANGRVYIINPNGVIFTDHSMTDVAHLYAAAGNVSNADFMAGKNHFTNVAGDVINQGAIRADSVALVGQHVANSGVILSDSADGMVAMVSGNDVTLTPERGGMSVKIAAPAEAPAVDGRAAVENSGQINARKGDALMVAGDLYALAINNTGSVKARDITLQGGSGRVQVGGSLNASDRSVGATGGNVTVTGRDIALTNADIDASGSRAGGKVRVGGDARGEGDLPHAQTVSVDSSSSIRADAVRRGEGGSIVVFADDHTAFHGEASASGGDRGGNGGFVETSGKNTLDISGARVDASGLKTASSSGKNGQWLLDPTDMVIDAAAATAIVSSLDTGTDVTIETGAAGSDAGNITVSSAIAKTAGGDATLTLRAANDVAVNADITSTSNKLNVNLFANNSGGSNTDADTTAGAVSINNAIVNANGGDVTAEGVDFAMTGTGVINAAAVNLRANSSADQSIGVGAGAGLFNVSSTELGAIVATDLNISTASRNDAANIGAIDVSGAGYNFGVRAGSVTSDAVTVASGKSISLRADAGSVNVTGALAAPSGSVDIQGDDLQLDSAGSSIISGTVRLTANGDRTIGLGGPGDFAISPTEVANITANRLEIHSAGMGNITVGNSGDPTMPIAPNATDLVIATGGKIDEVAADDNVDVVVPGRLTLQSGTGIGSAGTDDGTGTGPLDINAGELVASVSGTGGIHIKDTGGIDVISASTADGAISIRSTGAINATDLTATQAMPSGRTVELVANGGNITSTGALGSNGNVYLETTQADADIAIADAAIASGVQTTLKTNGSGGDATITNANGLTFADSSIGGNLAATATTGNIFDANTLAVGGNAGFTTAAANAVIDLNNLDVAGSIAVSTTGAGGNVNLVNAQHVDLASSSVGGSLGVTATTGNITNSGPVTVGDVAGFTTSAADADITLTQLTAPGLRLSTNGSGGDASVSAIAPLTFGDSTIGGSLTVVSTGAIDDSGALTVAGPASFKTLSNSGANIILDNAMNTFGVLSASARNAADTADAAGNITITERSIPGNTTMDVALISTAGAVTLTAPDIVIDTASMGPAITAGGDITLKPSTAGETVGIDAPADFSVSLAELQELSTTGQVTIGAADSGAVTVGASADLDLSPQNYDLRLRGGATNFAKAVTLAADRLFTLETGAITSADNATDIVVSGTNGRVAINSTGAVDLDINAAKLAASTTTGSIDVANAGTDLVIDSIAGVNGLSAPMDGNITVTTGGTLSVAAPVTTSGTGVVTLNAATGIQDTTTSGDAVTAPTVVLSSAAGAISGSGGTGSFKTNTSTLTATAPGGIDVANSGTGLLRATLTSDMGAANLSSGGAISTNGTAWTADSISITAAGNLTINDSLTTDNGDIQLTGNDLAINGVSTAVNAGMHDVVIARASDGTVGIGDITSEDMNIANEELAKITAANLTVGDNSHTTKITVRDVNAADSQNIGVVNLSALKDNAQILFTGANSTFNALNAQADAGIEVDSNIAADTGNLTLAADADMAADSDAPGTHQDQLFIHSGRVITTQPGGGDVTLSGSSTGTGMSAGIFSDGDLTIDSHQNVAINSSITVGGTLTLDAEGSVTLAGAGEGQVLNISANNGINFAESVTNQSGNLSINADADADGMGNFSLAFGKTLTTSDGDLAITAADFLLDGSIAAGSGDVTIKPSTVKDIAVGAFMDMAGRMTITGDELSRITCNNLNIGAGNAAAIIVDGVTASQSMGIGGLTTFDAGTTLTFSGAATTFNNIRGEADQDITVSAGLTTNGSLTLNADVDSNDSGLLTISAPIATNNGNFSGTGTDLVLTAAINSGTGDIAFSRSAAGSITVDNAPDAAGRMVINDAELALLTGGSLTIGGGVTDIVTVRNFTETDGAGISGMVSFDANQQLTFNGASTFKSLLGKSDNQVTVNGNLTTTVGDITLDGNANAADNTDDKIEIGSNRVIDSAGNLTLRAARGGIEGLGALTLRAGGDILVNNNLTTSGETAIHADSDGNGSGMFSLPASVALNTSGSNLELTASDVDLLGNIITGGGAASIDRSSAGAIAVGAFDTANGRMTISGAELARIVATGLTIGGVNTTSMKVNGVTDSNSNNIAGTLTLSALGTDGSVSFEGVASRFNSVSVKADTEIVTTVQIVADNGNITLDGGANTSDVNDGLIALGANLLASNTGTTTATNFFDINLLSPVRLRNNVTVEAEDTDFKSRVNSAPDQFRTLTINSHDSGTTTFRGNVGGADKLGGLFTNADGVTRLGADIITTRRGMTFDDRVTLIGDSMVRDFGAGIVFAKTVDSADANDHKSLTVISRLDTSATVNSVPIIAFGGDVGGNNPLKSIFLNYDPSANVNGRQNVPRVATIVARPLNASGQATAITGALRTFKFITSGDFRMGHNEKLTVGGNLRIHGGTGAYLGDLTALGNLTVNSPKIRLLRRDAGSLSARDPNHLTGTGTRVNDVDRGVDYVAGGKFSFSTMPVATGTGNEPQFGNSSGVRDDANFLASFIFQQYPNFNNALIDVGANPIITQDLKSSGPSDTNFATALAGAIPRESREHDVGQAETISSASFEDLEQLGVFPRNLTDEERIAGLIGWSTYDDFPETSAPSEAEFRTAVTRLPGNAATRVLAEHQRIFYVKTTDPKTGETRSESLAPAIKASFEESIKRYRAASGSTADKVDPIALREYIERTPQESASLTHARDLQGLLKDLELLGLSNRELRKCKSAVLRLARPNGLATREQFEIFLKTDVRKLNEQSVSIDAAEKNG